MELLPIIKQLADIGITAPAVIGVGILWQINKQFSTHDKRISVLEALQKRRKDD